VTNIRPVMSFIGPQIIFKVRHSTLKEVQSVLILSKFCSEIPTVGTFDYADVEYKIKIGGYRPRFFSNGL
jgi:hypothetical protein